VAEELGADTGSFGAIAGNWPWMIIASSTFLFWIAYVSRVSAVIYYSPTSWAARIWSRWSTVWTSSRSARLSSCRGSAAAFRSGICG